MLFLNRKIRTGFLAAWAGGGLIFLAAVFSGKTAGEEAVHSPCQEEAGFTEAERELTRSVFEEEAGQELTGSVFGEGTVQELPENVFEEKTGQELPGKAFKEEAEKLSHGLRDYEVMLKIVEAEAGCCDAAGKILVANVIMNRVKSGAFPDSIAEVVYEKAQFSPVGSGAIDQVEVTKETVDCVNRALGGEDHSRGALYFMNRGASQTGSVRWFDGKLTFLFSHGGHEFFK